jgi:hypothetical protein
MFGSLQIDRFIQLDKRSKKARIEEKTAEFLKQISKEETQINELNILH